MRLAEPLQACWQARLDLGFEARGGETVLARRAADGPLVVQKPFYPEGREVCHAIVVHPPGGIAAGDELAIQVKSADGAAALLTTPGAGKWYRSNGPWAQQRLAFEVDGHLEWLPRETIVFDSALARLDCEIRLGTQARYIGWEVMCLGRTGSGERFDRGRVSLETRIVKNDKLLWYERGEIDGDGPLMRSPVGLGGRSVFGTMLATDVPADVAAGCKGLAAVTSLPGLMLARYLGDSTEEALQAFTEIWKKLRPAVIGREAVAPRIWST
jgi:urease accessory protein